MDNLNVPNWLNHIKKKKLPTKESIGAFNNWTSAMSLYHNGKLVNKAL